MRPGRGSDNDPMMPRTGISLTIAQARASLREPSRPYTPADALHNRSLFLGQEYGSSRPTTGDCHNIGLRPETAAPTPRNQVQEKDAYSVAEKQHMYVAGGAEVFDVSAAQDEELNANNAPPAQQQPTPPRMSKSRSSQKREAKPGTENVQPPPSDPPAPPAMPAEVEAALAMLEPSNDPEVVLPACQTIIDYTETFCDFKKERPNDARSIQRKGFKLLEVKHAGLQARLARLALKVAGKVDNLLSVCKLIFRLSKDEENDTLFKEEGLVEEVLPLLETEGRLPPDGHIFVVGIIKNVALSQGNRDRMVRVGIIGILANILKQLEGKGAVGDRGAQLLVQITGALRNLSSASGDTLASVQQDILATGVLERMGHILETYANHEELILNISRMLHKLTLNAECREAIIALPHFVGGLLRALVPHVDNLAIVVRLCFVLGNITASDGPSRALIAGSGGVDLLGGILEKYDEQDIELCKASTAAGSEKGEEKKAKKARDTADVLTKVIRVMANLAIDEEVGPLICSHGSCSRIVDILERRRIDSSEELILNAVSAVTNLSFYDVENNMMLERQERVGVRLQPLLLHENDEAVVESVRAYGNFSRAQAARDQMVATHVDEVMIMLLDHANSEVVYSVCGVLMNLVADHTHKDVLGRMDGVKRLVKVVLRSGVTDVALSVIACRALFNYFLDSEEDPLGETEAEELYGALHRMLQMNEEEGVDHAQWPELEEVANKLIMYLEDEGEEEEGEDAGAEEQ